MLISKLTGLTGLLLAVCIVGAGAWGFARPAEETQPAPPVKLSAPPDKRPAAVPPKPAGRQVQIDVRVLHGKLSDNRLKVLAEPRLVTTDGRQCSFFSGDEQSVSAGKKVKAITIHSGFALKVTPTLLEGGKVHLDITLGETAPAEKPAGFTRFDTRGARIIGTFKLGEDIKIKGSGIGRMQVWVVELSVKELREAVK